MESLGVGEQVTQPHALAVEAGTTGAAAFGWRGRFIGDRIAASAGDEVVAGGEQGQDHLAGGIVSIGDQNHSALESGDHAEKEQDQAVELGAAVAIGPDHALADAGGQRDGGGVALCGAGEQGEALEAVSEDERRLGVVGRFLMELFDGGHLAAFLGSFEAVGDTHPVRTDTQGWEGIPTPGSPQLGEAGQIKSRAVEVVQQAFIV